MNKSIVMDTPVLVNNSKEKFYRKAIMKRIAIQKTENTASLFNFLRQKKLTPELGTPLNTVKETGRPAELIEKAGELIRVIAFGEFDKFEEGDPDPNRVEFVSLKHAVDLNGHAVPYYRKAVNDYESPYEMNLAVTIGQLFSIAHQNGTVTPTNPLPHSANCSSLHKTIQLGTAYTNDIIVKSFTKVWFPENKDEVYYAITGNSGMQFCGIDSFVSTFLAYDLDSLNHVYVDSQKNHFMRVLRLAANNGRDDVDEYRHYIEIVNEMKLPAGKTEFVFVSHLESTVYSSKDFSDLSSLKNSEAGFAMVDFRNRQYGRQYPVMRDPLGAWEKQPFGGGRVYTTLEFYTIENSATI